MGGLSPKRKRPFEQNPSFEKDNILWDQDFQESKHEITT